MLKFFVFGAATLFAVLFVSGCVLEKEVYTPAEVWENKNWLVGKQITVEGVAAYYQVACTGIACTPKDPCCNYCSGGLGLRIDNERVLNIRGEFEEKGHYGVYSGKPVNCAGNECDIQCYPLEQGKSYRVIAILGKEILDISPYEEFYLKIKLFETI